MLDLRWHGKHSSYRASLQARRVHRRGCCFLATTTCTSSAGFFYIPKFNQRCIKSMSILYCFPCHTNACKHFFIFQFLNQQWRDQKEQRVSVQLQKNVKMWTQRWKNLCYKLFFVLFFLICTASTDISHPANIGLITGFTIIGVILVAAIVYIFLKKKGRQLITVKLTTFENPLFFTQESKPDVVEPTTITESELTENTEQPTIIDI